MPIETDADPMTPYQLPFPKEALDEIIIPDAMPKDDRLWVPPGRKCLVSASVFKPLSRILDNITEGAQGGGVVSSPASTGCSRICFERPLALFRT
jgi:hypothetical protein